MQQPTYSMQQPTYSMQQPTYPPLSEDFKCPIGRNIMCDPVIAADGHVYDHVNISNWFEISGGTKSPMTNLDMDTDRVYGIVFLHSQIKEWLENIKNHTIPTDIMELVDYYYETQRLDAERILTEMDIINNNNLLIDNQNVINNENRILDGNGINYSITDNSVILPTANWITGLSIEALPPNVELFTQDTDDAIMDEIERAINDEQIRSNMIDYWQNMFVMFNASEPIG
jgi:hypothetical protein